MHNQRTCLFYYKIKIVISDNDVGTKGWKVGILFPELGNLFHIG